MNVYGNSKLERWLKAAWEKSGKKHDKGKSCLSFETAEAHTRDVIAEAIERTPLKDHVERYATTRGAR
jgi:hypothetical protein